MGQRHPSPVVRLALRTCRTGSRRLRQHVTASVRRPRQLQCGRAGMDGGPGHAGGREGARNSDVAGRWPR